MIIVRNATAAAEQPAPPVNDAGSPYEFEMIVPGYGRRVYADHPEELLGILSPGYQETEGPQSRAQARIHLAVRAQVHVQSVLADPDALAECTEAQRAILLGARDLPPAVESWNAPIPLVLVTTFYRPTGRLPRPREDRPDALVWIDPSTDVRLLTTLHTSGWIRLASRTPWPDGA